jgi:hypothetical protein
MLQRQFLQRFEHSRGIDPARQLAVMRNRDDAILF